MRGVPLQPQGEEQGVRPLGKEVGVPASRQGWDAVSRGQPSSEPFPGNPGQGGQHLSDFTSCCEHVGSGGSVTAPMCLLKGLGKEWEAVQ